MPTEVQRIIAELKHYDKQCRDWGLHPIEDLIDPDLKDEIKDDLAAIQAFLKAELAKRQAARHETDIEITEENTPF